MSEKSTAISTPMVMGISAVAFVLIILLMALMRPALVDSFYPLPEDQGAAWYQWQTYGMERSARIVLWGTYLLHQFSVWGIFIAARREKSRREAAMTGREREELRSADVAFGKPGLALPDKFTWMMLAANLFFVILHLIQTRIWYDGLAQDVPIWTSQGSVIVVLVLLLVMEMPRRGLIWGRWRYVPEGFHRFLRRFHGPYIAWALVYTFWFHPMEGNWGLISGFVYMFILFTQMIIFRAWEHKRRGTTVLMEVFVAVHGTLITVYKNNDVWPMFLFGFMTMFVLSYMHTWKMSGLLKAIVLVMYLGIIAAVYGLIRGWSHAFELTFIPVALYGGAIVLWAAGYIIDRIMRRDRPEAAV